MNARRLPFGSEEVDLRNYWRVVRKHSRLVIAVIVGMMLLCVAYHVVDLGGTGLSGVVRRPARPGDVIIVPQGARSWCRDGLGRRELTQ